VPADRRPCSGFIDVKVSAKSEYACLAMLVLARLVPNDPPARIREISEAHGIPERYLVQILLQLKAAGLVTSTRGAAGGYRLARPATSISLREVLTAIDGPDAPSRPSQKPAARALAAVWDHVRAAEHAVLDRTSIAQIAELTTPHEWVI
jgi:Rrf2 family transcriptional regulator, cysteine metabolism repressor